MNRPARNTTQLQPIAQVQPLAVIGGNPYLTMLDRALANGQSMESLQSLLDLQIKWEANEARKAFVDAMAAFKLEPMVIEKNTLVEFLDVRYYHAELADCTAVIVPNLAKHGFSHAWKTEQTTGAITVTCTLTHRLGHSESVAMSGPPDASGKKNAIQAIGSTNTYLQRYTLLAAVGMATGGQDNDGRGVDDDDDDGQGDTGDTGTQQSGSQSPEAIARRKAKHDEALGRNSESVTFIKDRLAADDLAAAAGEWRALSHDDQMALWLAPSKGGCFTTSERATLHDKLPPVNA